MQERQIRVIPGRNAPEFRQHDQKRACAYVRVSTGHSAQMHSLQNQTNTMSARSKAIRAMRSAGFTRTLESPVAGKTGRGSWP